MLFRSDRKSTRLNSSHLVVSYAVFCLKKKTTRETKYRDPPTEPNARTGEATPPGITRQASFFFFFNDPATPEIYPLPLPAALPIGFLFAHPCPDGVSRVPLLPRPRPVAF